MLITAADQTLLTQHQVTIEIDADDGCGIIVIQERRFKVSLLIQASGEEDWKVQKLEEAQMRETASKVAVMLLKKELLQKPQEHPLKLAIYEKGFTHLSDQEFISAHADADANKNTQADYTALIKYLTEIGQKAYEDEEIEEIEMKIQLEEDATKIKDEKKKL